MFTDGIATKWASHIHRGLTVYTEQSLVPPLFYHSIDISCTFPLFPYSMNLYITYFFYWHLHINHSAKEKKFMRFLWQKQGNCCSLLYSIKPTVTTNFKYVPRSSKASFSCCCWKQSFCSSCSSSIPDHCRMAPCQTLHHYLARYEDQIQRNHLEWSRSKRFPPTKS